MDELEQEQKLIDKMKATLRVLNLGIKSKK
jgi:hypothetical protein